MTSLTSFLRVCCLLSLLRPMLPSVGGFAISSDGYFCFQKQTSSFHLHSFSEIVKSHRKEFAPIGADSSL